LKKWISYIFPITRKVQSEFSGELELTTFNGKKVLDSANANYSFGTLQKLLEKGLRQVNFEEVNQALVLGMGAGSVIDSLRNKFRYKKSIDAVEWDKEIVKIAAEEFEIVEGKGLKIFLEDAFVFIQNCNKKYDLIIVDLFIDCKVPEQFYSDIFCENLAKSSNRNAKLLFNLGLNSDGYEQGKKVAHYFSEKLHWKCTVKNRVNGTNTLMYATNV